MNKQDGWDDDLDDLEDGWGEDNDDFFDDDGEESNLGVKAELPVSSSIPTGARIIDDPPPSTPAVVEKSATSADGWDDDEDFFDEEDENVEEVNKAIAQHLPPLPADILPPFAKDLSGYIISLPQHASSIQMVLAAEYNTEEKALELRDYYVNRPSLLEYTLDKEVPRMDYTVVLAGDVSSDKQVVRNMLRSADSICSRCANQSLLADILQVLTGPDRVVRPQHMATAIATQCQFHIDLDSSVVQAIATLELSLPTSNGRWKVAEIRVFVVFEPEQLSVDFRVAEIQLMPQDTEWHDKLKDSATLLEMLSVEDQFDPLPPQQQEQNFRDRFLQSQNLLQASAAGAVKGMKSAWQDIDAATGFGSKIKNILPDTNALVQQAEASEIDVPPPKHRPTSILGGFVRSLAKSVAIPDEEEWQPPQARHAVAEPPKLYNIGPEPSTNGMKESPPVLPQLYNRDTKEASNLTEQLPIHGSGNRPSWEKGEARERIDLIEPDVEDGWGDLSVADDETIEETAKGPEVVDTMIRDRKRWINPRASAPRSLSCI